MLFFVTVNENTLVFLVIAESELLILVRANYTFQPYRKTLEIMVTAMRLKIS